MTDRTTDVPNIAADAVLHTAADLWALRRTRYGVMLSNPYDAYIGRSYALYGEYAAEELQFLRQFVAPGWVVVDAGANVGAHAVCFAQAVGPAGTVHAFEPQRLISQALNANVALNGLTNVRCYHAALSDAAGSVRMPDLDHRAPNNFGGVAVADTPGGEPTPVLTVDSLDLERCDLIKIDVEGTESRVIAGARATIARHHPLLYVENDRPEQSAALVQYVVSLGYRVYAHTPKLYSPENYYRNPDDVFVHIVSKNLFCMHPAPAAPPGYG